MPKEIIQCTQEAVNEADPPDGQPASQVRFREIAVGWVKQSQFDDGSVTVGVLGEQGTGTHAEVTRQEINRVIRALRRARDGAFGSDA